MQNYHNLSTDKINVVAPMGGFGNHVRNILMLDDRFAFKITPTEHSYNIFAGPDWPTYDEYCTLGLNASMPNNIREEIQGLCEEFKNLLVVSAITPDQKMNYIIDHIYPIERSWNNWMIYEIPFRYDTKDLIEHFHDPRHCSPDVTTVRLTCDPRLALYAYFKFNSNLNNTPREKFLSAIEEYNQECNNNISSNIIVLSSDSLNAPILDPLFYNTLIERLEFNNHYKLANQMHQRWHYLHKKAEREFVQFVTNFYN